jgi:hypothetical protein
MRDRRKRFVFEKKAPCPENQKLLLKWTTLVKSPVAQNHKSFLLLFFKKAALSFRFLPRAKKTGILRCPFLPVLAPVFILLEELRDTDLE